MRRENVRPRFFKQGDYLIALHAWKALQKLLDRVTSFEVIKQALRRYAGPDEYRLTSKDFRILGHHSAHAETIRSKPVERQTFDLPISSDVTRHSPHAPRNPSNLDRKHSRSSHRHRKFPHGAVCVRLPGNLQNLRNRSDH